MADPFHNLTASLFGQSLSPALPKVSEGITVRRHVLSDKVKRVHVSSSPVIAKGANKWLSAEVTQQLAAISYRQVVSEFRSSELATTEQQREQFIRAYLRELEQRLCAKAGLFKGKGAIHE